MLMQALWWSGLMLEALLVVRSFATRLRTVFPFFYSYVMTVFLTELFRFYIYEVRAVSYQSWYWVTEIFVALVGYGVIVELYERVLSRFPGVARFLKGILLSTLVLAIASAFVTRWSLPRLSSDLEHNLRLVQAALLMLLLGLIGHYRIPVGKNTKGVLVGYGLFIGYKSIQSVVYSQAQTIDLLTRMAPLVYLVSLIVWSKTLWSASSQYEVEGPKTIERDYDSLVATTRLTLTRARAYMARGVR